MSRSALAPFMVPLCLLFGGHLLWFYICGWFLVLSDWWNALIGFVL